MHLTEDQITAIAPDEVSIKAGKKLNDAVRWSNTGLSTRVVWGEAQGSGSRKYKSQVDLQDLAFKCNCPSRKFPCKHCLGLLYLAAGQPQLFATEKEPEWVSEWMDKRQAKATQPVADDPDIAPSDEEQAKKDKAKQVRFDERMTLVRSGIDELDLWLQDIVRLGLLHLPQKPASEFINVAARMIDAKASGLASWVKSLANVDYTQKDIWIDDAMGIIAKLNLIIQSFRNYDKLTPEWQYTVRTLIGWSQSTKDLLADENAYTYKDQWLIIGQEREEMDDLVIERTWMIGLHGGLSALVLNFGTRFSPLVSKLVPGVAIESQLAYFPSVWKHRAVVKMTKEILKGLPILPLCFPDWNEFEKYRAGILSEYPWADGIPFTIQDIQLVIKQEASYICDKQKRYLEVDPQLSEEACLKMLSITAGESAVMAGVYRYGKVLPLGLFVDERYVLL